jgi:hypothetical protein
MIIINHPGKFEYVASTGDWRLIIGNGQFNILPQVGNWDYTSGINLDNLADLIVNAKVHATANNINWNGD